MRPLGQVENTYIVAAGPRGLYLIDQHAAHERVLFERLGSSTDAPTQRLLDPTSVELSAEESDWVASHADDLRTLGFDVTSFGPSAWLLRAVPSALGSIDAATYLREVVAEAQTPDFQRLAAADRLRWSLACRAAIKSGAPLAFDEMSASSATSKPVTSASPAPTAAPPSSSSAANSSTANSAAPEKSRSAVEGNSEQTSVTQMTRGPSSLPVESTGACR